MNGTKIIVFQLRELIKTAIFAIIGILLIIGLIYFFLPKKTSNEIPEEETTKEKNLYVPGTYKSQINLHNTNGSPLNVLVTVSENKITDIQLSDAVEELDYFYPLIKPTMNEISKSILEKQKLEVAYSEDNKFTTQILVTAVNNALLSAVSQ